MLKDLSLNPCSVNRLILVLLGFVRKVIFANVTHAHPA